MKFSSGKKDTGWLTSLLYNPAQPEVARFSLAQLTQQSLAILISASLILIPMGQGAAYAQQAPAPAQAAQPLSADQLDQLVAPIALYPDALVAQVLAAATYPTQVVEADRWRQAQGNAS